MGTGVNPPSAKQIFTAVAGKLLVYHINLFPLFLENEITYCKLAFLDW